MRIAFFSDVHSNLPALEAVLTHIDSQKPDMIFCLGDLVGYNVWANEVIATIRSRRIPTLAGNYDEGVGLSSDDCGCAYKSEEDKIRGAASISYTNQIISEENRAYLRMLPNHMQLTFKAGEEKIRLLMVHGSPRKINEYLFEDRTDKSIIRMMDEAGADILLFGHTHKPYHKVLTDEVIGGNQFKHAVNLGSVGKPKDGDARACYVLLTLNSHSLLQQEAGVKVEFVRVGYDVEKAARAVEESPLPDAFAAMLRNAY